VKVVGGGCAGFSTKLDLVSEYDSEKDLLEELEGVKVVVDKRSALYLEGAKVDYYSDLNKRGFIVNVPGTKTTCGCGSSFSF